MVVGVWLIQATTKLQKAGIETARLDCLVLLEDVLGKDRSMVLAHPDTTLDTTQQHRLNNFITQRIRHKPLAYIRGEALFYGRQFIVNKYVLVPRPETEALITLLKKIVFPVPPRIADMGAGSGCVGVTAALEVPGSTVDFYDIDADALAVANQNARHYNLRTQYYEADIFEQNHGPYDVVFANLPYVPEKYPINQAAAHEPRIALFSGADGLDHYRTLWQYIAAMPPGKQPSHVVTESFPEQHAALIKRAKAAGYTLAATDDFAQHFVA